MVILVNKVYEAGIGGIVSVFVLLCPADLHDSRANSLCVPLLSRRQVRSIDHESHECCLHSIQGSVPESEYLQYLVL